MTDTLPPFNQDFAPNNAIVQSPMTSTEDIPSFVYLHSTCRKCNHWFNKQRVPYPFPEDGSFDVECPNCHTKLLRFGTQSSQETFMTQATNSRPGSMDLQSIESLIHGNPGPSVRVRLPFHFSRTRTEPARITLVAASNPGQPMDNETTHGALPGQNLTQMPQTGVQESELIVPTQEPGLVDNSTVTDINVRLPDEAGQDNPPVPLPENALKPSASASPTISPPSTEKTNIPTPERAGIEYQKPSYSGRTSRFRRRIATFFKTKVIASVKGHYRSGRTTVVPEPSSVGPDETAVVDNPVNLITADSPTQVETNGQNESSTVEAATQTDYQHLAPPNHATEIARARARSAPPVPLIASQRIEGVATAPTKDEHRRQTREEKAEKAQQKILESRRCPCWPQCQCYPDGPRQQIQRVHSLPRRLTDIPAVRDLLRTDQFYHEIQRLSRQVRTQREDRNQERFVQYEPTPSQVPSQDGTAWSSLATTLSGNTGFEGLPAFSLPDGLHRNSSGTQAIRVNTDFGTDTLAEDDQNPTPRPGHPTTQMNGIHAESPDADFLGIGGVHDDSMQPNTGRANQRNRA